MAVKIFFCYAHEDEALLNKLKIHLRPLLRQGLIDIWHDRDIRAGTEWEQEIKQHLNSAQIVLLLVSPDFMDSDYSYDIEMQRALERHERGEARVIPIILRPVDFEVTPFRKLQALPTDAKPVMSSSWQYQDEAFVNVTKGIRKVVEEITTKSSAPLPALFSELSKPEQILPLTSVLKQQTVNPEPQVTPEDLSWHCIRTLTGHDSHVWSVAISPDGQTLASGSADKTIKLWNLKTGDLLCTLTGHEDAIWSVAISPDGQALASGSYDKTIKQWEKK
jgi:TIR domain-containing protein/WD40 domain-containing protein